MNPQRILVVDTDGLFLTRIRAFFECYGNGNEVVTLADGREAMSIINKGMPFDSVFISPELPVVNGLDVLRHIGKTQPQTERWMLVKTIFPGLTEETASFLNVQVISKEMLGNKFLERNILSIPENELRELAQLAA